MPAQESSSRRERFPRNSRSSPFRPAGLKTTTSGENTDAIQAMRLEHAGWGHVAAIETINAWMHGWRERGSVGEPPFTAFEAARLLRVGTNLEQTAPRPRAVPWLSRAHRRLPKLAVEIARRRDLANPLLPVIDRAHR